mmetsp:Transcript_14536/g.16252  ORF Transcript_14536/g.16252 Transcript_14536/m.16252 type:complete len:573 (+) Transcript_14536:269-1987(+)
MQLLVDGLTQLSQGAIPTGRFDFPDEEKVSMSAGRIMGVIFFSFFAMLLILGVVVEYTSLLNKPSRGEERKDDPAHNKTVVGKMIISFSPSRNLKKLFYSPFNDKDNLKVLNGVRFYSCLYVILGHAYFNVLINPTSNPTSMNSFVQPLWFQAITGGFFAVDVFFFLSGLLGAYLMILKFEKSKKMNFPMIFFHRFYRLAPNVLLIIFFASTFYPFLGEGPVWGIYQDFWTRDCPKYFWTFATFINSIYPGDKVQCFGWLWYLSHDFLFFIALTFQVFAYIHKRSIAYILAIFLFVANIALVMGLVAHFDISSSILIDPNYGEKIYFRPWSRLGAYQVGVIMGMFYYEYIKGDQPEGDKSKIGYKVFKSIRDGTTLRRILYVSGFVMIVAVVWAITPETRMFMLTDENKKQLRYLPTWFNVVYIAFCRPLYVLGVGFLVAGPMVGKGSFLQWFLGAAFYAPWTKFTFYAYMIHLFVFSFYFGQQRQTVMLYHPSIIWIYIGVIILTFIIAVPLSTAFESPLMQLERLVLFPPKKRRTETKEKLLPQINNSVLDTAGKSESSELNSSTIKKMD